MATITTTATQTAVVPPYAPIQPSSHPLPSDRDSAKPPRDRDPYRSPVETSFPAPPGPTPPYAPQPSALPYPGPSSYPGPPLAVTDHIPGPPLTPLPLATATRPSLKDTRRAAELALREYTAMRRSRYGNEAASAGLEERLRIQASTVLGDLRALRRDVSDMVKSAESHRWRRFLVGGILASFIPAVRTLFRRPTHDTDAANDTEYAFRRSRSLVSRILNSVHRPGIATLAFFVFAVMYVFQNEVTLRVARTVSRRLKKLSSKIERGHDDISDDDLNLLQGWRWRILLWG